MADFGCQDVIFADTIISQEQDYNMDRRKFIKQTGTLIAGAALAPYAVPENAARIFRPNPWWTPCSPYESKLALSPHRCRGVAMPKSLTIQVLTES